MSSGFLPGVGRDAEHVVEHIVARYTMHGAFKPVGDGSRAVAAATFDILPSY